MQSQPSAPARASEAKPARPVERKPFWPAGAALQAPERKDAGAVQHLDADCEFKFADGGEAEGAVEGYASKFDLLDRGGDIVKPGAFKATIADWKRKKAMPPMLWQHSASTPIGVWTDMKEDEVGLAVKGQLILDVPQAAIVRSLIKGGAVKGLSIGYITRDADYDRQTGARHLKKVDLWEISPVTFPMLPEAQISGVKGDIDPKALERALRDEGLSNRDAKAAISVFRKHALRDAGSSETGPRDEATEILMTLRKAVQALRD
jgi:HK97 family phage prohead protease